MMETGPGCFECDIREDEMSHSNLALDKVPCSKSQENSAHDLALCWFITADHLQFIHRPLIQNWKAFVKITSFKQTATKFPEVRVHRILSKLCLQATQLALSLV